jgi:hypothetical protein
MQGEECRAAKRKVGIWRPTLQGFGDDDVSGVRGGNVFGAVIAELWQIDAGEKILASAEEDRGNCEMHLVHEPRLKILADGGGASGNVDVLALGSVDGSFECSADAIGDEVKRSAAVHGDRFARVVGEHEDGSVKRRVVAPPAFPEVVGPASADWPEHIAADDPSSQVTEAARGEVVVGASCAAFGSMLLPQRPSCDHPFVQRSAANAKRVVEILIGTGAKAVEGNREVADAEFGHGLPLFRILPDIAMRLDMLSRAFERLYGGR